MKNLLLVAVTILAVGCGGKNQATDGAKSIIEKQLEVKSVEEKEQEVEVEEPVVAENKSAKEDVQSVKPKESAHKTTPVEENQEKVKEEVKAEDIVGKWDGKGINFIFNEDGTVEALRNGKIIETGTWSIKDGKIHTVNSGEFGPRGRVVIYSLSDEGHLQPPSGGSVFKKIK